MKSPLMELLHSSVCRLPFKDMKILIVLTSQLLEGSILPSPNILCHHRPCKTKDMHAIQLGPLYQIYNMELNLASHFPFEISVGKPRSQALQRYQSSLKFPCAVTVFPSLWNFLPARHQRLKKRERTNSVIVFLTTKLDTSLFQSMACFQV